MWDITFATTHFSSWLLKNYLGISTSIDTSLYFIKKKKLHFGTKKKEEGAEEKKYKGNSN